MPSHSEDDHCPVCMGPCEELKKRKKREQDNG